MAREGSVRPLPGRLRAGICAAAAALLALPPAPRSLAAPPRGDGFEAFCTTWMQKLAVREWANLTHGKFDRRGSDVVIEYTGYDRRPSRCEARRSARGKSRVGIIVYHEHHYLKRGTDAARALASEPQRLTSVEVTEVFRNDGKRWLY